MFRSGFFRCMEVFGCNADVSSRRCGSGFVRARGWCLTAVGSCVSQGRRRLSNILGLSHFWALASLRARVNCRRFLAEQFFWSGDVCWACVSRVPCASKWWGSKIVLSIDEKKGRSAKCFRDEVNSANVGSVSNMLRICMFMFSLENVMSDVLHRCFPYRCFAARFVRSSIHLVDPASSHMIVSKMKPCMSQYKPIHGNTANGSIK